MKQNLFQLRWISDANHANGFETSFGIKREKVRDSAFEFSFISSAKYKLPLGLMLELGYSSINRIENAEFEYDEDGQQIFMDNFIKLSTLIEF